MFLSIVFFTGCLYSSNNEYPPSYKESVDTRLFYDPAVFYFGDVVQDDGSVNVTKTINWTLRIENHGEREEDVRFELTHFPRELMVWSTDVRFFQRTVTNNTTITLQIVKEYDYEDEDFKRLRIENIPSNSSIDIIVSITFNKTVPWSYDPDSTFVGFLEIGRRTCNPSCGNIDYEEEIIPFVVRT